MYVQCTSPPLGHSPVKGRVFGIINPGVPEDLRLVMEFDAACVENCSNERADQCSTSTIQNCRPSVMKQKEIVSSKGHQLNTAYYWSQSHMYWSMNIKLSTNLICSTERTK